MKFHSTNSSEVKHLTSGIQDALPANCKKQTVVATSTTKAEYVAVASYCGQIKRAATTASSLEAEHEQFVSLNMSFLSQHILPSTVLGNRQRQTLIMVERGTDCLPTAIIFEELAQMGRKQRKDTAFTQEETQQDDSVPTPSNDPPLSGEDSMQLSELMILCTNLQKQVLDLEKAKDAQAKEIADLKKRGRSDNEEMFDINDLHSDEVNVDMPVGEKQEQSAKEREVDTSVEDIDENLARSLQAQLEAELIEEERLARKKKEEANIALIESWDNTQAMMEADFELAQRLQTEEQGEITIEERSRLFVELMNKRKKHFAKLRAEEKRRKPPTKAQKRNQMSTYLKNMGRYKHNQLKSKSNEEI
ncbi:hypothetical protein Tco_1134355 [Tanacetum coccineum]